MDEQTRSSVALAAARPSGEHVSTLHATRESTAETDAK